MRIDRAIGPAALAVVLLTSCGKDEATPPLDLGYAYFPVKVGHYVDYQVDTVWRNDITNISDSLTYFLREVIEEDFVDLEGRPSQRIMLYVQDSLGVWVVRDVWAQTRYVTGAERTEENLRLQKLIFGIATGKKWDLNARNAQAAYEVTYDAVDVPWTANGLAFDSTVVVRSTFLNNLVDTDIHTEHYAKGVGLVFKYREVSNTQTIYQPPNPPYQEVVGTKLTMTVIGYGEL